VNIKTLIKVIASSILIPITSFGILILTLFVFPNTLGLCLGVVLGFSFMMLVIAYGYPVWFKDYIEEFWEKKEKEEKEKCQEKEEAEEPI